MTEVRVALSEEIDRYLDSLVRRGPFVNKAELVRAALVAFSGQAGPIAVGFDQETVFAPDGRVYQLEYAREAVRRGGPAVGIVFEGGVVLAASPAREGRLSRGGGKVWKLADRLGVLSAGLVADAQIAVSHLRQAQPKTTEQAVEHLVRFYWEYTVDRGKRPLGAGLLVAGALGGAGRLFYLDPSAAIAEYDAIAIGEDSDRRMEMLEKRYRRGTAKEAERLAAEVLGKPEKIEILRVPG